MAGPPAGATVVGYRIADWHAAMRVNPTRSPGRFHRPGQIVQYLCLHPYGPYAEMLRNHPAVPASEWRFRLWAARFPAHGLVVVDDDLAAAHGTTIDELMADDYTAGQNLADALTTAGATGLVAPSAALPGTHNAVLFGERVGVAYQELRLLASSVPCAVAAEAAQPAPNLEALVRHHGDPWTRVETFREPALPIRR